MPIDTENIQETLRFLIDNSDPEGLNHPRLVKIMDMVNRNVLIGPNSRKFIAECLAKFDNVECSALSRNGKCKVQKQKPCRYKKRFSQCPLYMEQKPERKGAVIDLGGNDE